LAGAFSLAIGVPVNRLNRRWQCRQKNCGRPLLSFPS
jgi:hypothetical protein